MWTFLRCLLGVLLSSCLYATPLTIGTLSYDPPFETAADNQGHFYGFEMDLMNEICKRLHEPCQYKPLTFEQILSETQLGHIDIAIAGITITSDRQKQYLFSLPYLVSKAQLLTKSQSNINTLEDIEGKRLGVEASATIFKGLLKATFDKVIIIEYASQSDLFQAMANDKIDLIFIDQASAKYWVDNSENILKLVGNEVVVGAGYGIMAKKNQTGLIGTVDKVIVDMQNDGTYSAIYSRYF